jgi:hypothetical protein
VPEPSPTQRSCTRSYFVPIIALALTLRLAIIFLTLRSHPATWFFAQASELDQLARSLLSGHGLSSPFGGATGPSAFLAPGYPAFITAVFYVFGPDTLASAAAIMLLQALFATATVAVIMLLARRLFNNSTANLAGLIWAIAPPLLFFPTIFWETNLSALLLISIVALSFLCSTRTSYLTWFALAFCALVALLTNPSLGTAAAGCFAWAVFQSRKQSPKAAPWIAALLCLALFSLWPIRNYRQMHAFIPLRTNLGYELWQGNRAGSNGFFTAALHPNTNATEFARYRDLGELGYMREKSSIAKEEIRSHPGRFLRLTAKRVVFFWLGIAETSVWPMIAYATTTFLLGLGGLWLLMRAKQVKSTALLFLIPLVLLPLPYYLTHPDFRFRCVIDPLLTLLAAHALLACTSANRRRTKPTT